MAKRKDSRRKALVVTPLVGLGPVKFGMTRDEVEKLLGTPDSAKEVGKGGYVDMNYGSRGFFIGVGKNFGVVMISCVSQKVMAIRVRDFSGKTDKGIALGASAAEIARAHGDPDGKSTDKGTTHLSYNRLKAHFTLYDDKLVSLMISRQGAGN